MIKAAFQQPAPAPGQLKPGRLSKRKSAFPFKSPPPDPSAPRQAVNLANLIAHAKSTPSLVNDRAIGSASLPPISRHHRPTQTAPAFEMIKHTVVVVPTYTAMPLPPPPTIMVTRRSASAAAHRAPSAEPPKAKMGRPKNKPAIEKIASAAMRPSRSAPSHPARPSVSPPLDNRRKKEKPTINTAEADDSDSNAKRPKRVASSQNVNMTISDEEDGDDSNLSNKRRKVVGKRATSAGPTSPLAKTFAVDNEKLTVNANVKRGTRMASPLRNSNESDDEDSAESANNNGRRSGSKRIREGPVHLKDYEVKVAV